MDDKALEAQFSTLLKLDDENLDRYLYKNGFFDRLCECDKKK